MTAAKSTPLALDYKLPTGALFMPVGFVMPVVVAAAVVLIWKTAAGNSLVSPCTTASMPMLAKAPRMRPQGNQRN